MTDKTTPDLTYDDRRHARDWAEHIVNCPDTSLPLEAAAARVILHAVPAPTFADMTADERAECHQMQADVKGYESRVVVLLPNASAGRALLLVRQGHVAYEDHASIIPRPDLPRLEWPGDTPAPTPPALPEGWLLANHPDYGRVVVTNASPDSLGRVSFVAPAPGTIGNDWHICRPAELTYLDTPDTVPPNTLTVGSVWHDVDALARACEESGRDQIVVSEHGGCIFVWDEMAEWWEGSAPPRYTPCTIIHAGREADQ